MDELSTLRALQAVKEHGTVTAAASVLRLSPSAVSQQLKRLERTTGRQLLTPTGRRVTLTPEAHALLGEAGPLLERFDMLLGSSTRDEDDELVGHVRVAAFTTAIRHGALKAISDVQETHSRLSCSLSEMDPEAANHALAAGTVDVAVTHHWTGQIYPALPGITARPVVRDIADVISHVDLPLPLRPTFEELARYAWVSTGAGTICHSWLTQMFAMNNVRPRVTMEISDFALHIQFVSSRLGLALVPRLGRPLLPACVRVLDLDETPARCIYIAVRSQQVNDHAIAAVVEALSSRLTAQVEEPGEAPLLKAIPHSEAARSSSGGLVST